MMMNACGQKTPPPPNFVFILVDDLGWKDLSCYGSDFYETPNIDKLASNGVLFTDAYAACPVCSPTRAAIMTGKHPVRLNITDWIPGDDPKNRKLTGPKDQHELALEETTIAEALSGQGYKAFFAGKWHLGDTGYLPEDQGFEINIGGHHRGSPPGGYYVPYNNPKITDGPEGEYLSDRLTDESITFIRNHTQTPFLVYLSFYNVHTPIQANHEHVMHYEHKLEAMGSPQQEKLPEHEAFTTQNQANAAYASMIHAVDANIGKLLEVLEQEGLDDKTVIFFTSDNGGLSTIQHPDWTAPTSILPLRAGKGWCYEGGIRVPLIINGPGIKPAISHTPVISMDFFPTIMEMTGSSESIDETIDGISLCNILNGKESTLRNHLYWHYPHYHGSGWTPGAAIRSGNYKLISFYDLETTELYDLENDPGETLNLADSLPSIVSEMKSKLRKMQKEDGALFPAKNSP
jgi:arylsulfatase A-like enzyme